MNKHDSERMAGLLARNGHTWTDDMDEADLVVFNTCTVRQHAEDRLIGNVAGLKRLKAVRPEMIIAVGGCVAQKEKERLLEKLPHVDVVFGTHNYVNLPQLVERAQVSTKPVCEVLDALDLPPNGAPSLREEKHHAWVPIVVGCNNFCTYCVVPHVRGREVSRPVEDLKNEVEKLVADGVVEVTLLGQNVNSYGRDLYGKPQFARLMSEINEVNGLERIRFTTSHPKDLSEETIQALAELEKVCEHLHLPVQAGSTRVLAGMNRRYAKEDYLRIVEKVYATLPEIALTTDIMVGFPDETEEDFKETLDVVERARFDYAFTFIYSPREGTPAAKMGDLVPHEVKADRFERLLKVQNRISLEKNAALVGRVIQAFVEGPSKRGNGTLTARTRTNKVINFSGGKELIHGMVNILIEEARTHFLMGRVVR
ncbi:MAG: tRNA (N6-isopentenyl adenosine(37)-C2)-methylthiotransferase MiaB [Actinobacteria bacterium]|nr:tRNA (N6-isopentenyl adenosine(37)-C2)-methylthiotransferase MiaB [Actinomycetota bacterium]